MQSRLLPEIDGKWQAHPANRWQEEFSIAKKLDLDLIEFIFDSPSAACNPLVSKEGINAFFNKSFTISKLSDRMGMRLEGHKIDNIVNTNIKSEGLIKGVVQVPADGNPIIMLSDHGTIGGYPKIGVVISADYDKLVQLTSGSKIRFQEIDLSEAETLYDLYQMETKNIISQIK